MSFLKKLISYMGLDEDELLVKGKPLNQNDVLDLVANSEQGAINSSYEDFKTACRFIEESIRVDEPIVIYGDYDVDGLTSTTIMSMMLKFLGVEKVGFFIPSRYDNGYGLNKSILEKMVSSGYKRLIGVDNGITKMEEIDYLSANGVKVLILDHHEEQKDSYPSFDGKDKVLYHRNDVSAACLALLVASEVMLKSKTVRNGDKRDCLIRYFFTLAGLAVHSDCMSLKKFHNFALAKLGLQYINEYLSGEREDDFCGQLYSNVARLANKKVGDTMTFTDINFSINSKLNSIARMKGGLITNIGAYYLMGESYHNNRNIYIQIENISNEKKLMVRNAMSTLRMNDIGYMYVVDACDDVNVPSGLSGLVASSLMNKEEIHKPILVLCSSSIDKNDIIGSFRSEPGYTLDKIIDDPTVRELIKDHGGHSQACGLTFRRTNKDIVISRMNELLKNYKKEEVKDKYIEVSLDELGEEMYNDFEKLEPYGQDFEKPKVGIVVDRNLLEGSPNEVHILAKLDKGSLSENRKIVFFGGRKYLKENPQERILLIGNMTKDVFKGNVTYSFKVEKAKGINKSKLI